MSTAGADSTVILSASSMGMNKYGIMESEELLLTERNRNSGWRASGTKAEATLKEAESESAQDEGADEQPGPKGRGTCLELRELW